MVLVFCELWFTFQGDKSEISLEAYWLVFWFGLVGGEAMVKKKGKAEDAVEKTGEAVGKGLKKGFGVAKGLGKGLVKGVKGEEKKKKKK
jgi:hypothetical protein